MKRLLLTILTGWAGLLLAQAQTNPPNRLIDYPRFLNDAHAAGELRATRRLTEADFLTEMKTPGTVLLDARSKDKYELRHLTGAVNLPFTDFTADTLAQTIPTKGTKVLIYCNNNFLNSPRSFASKAPAASLNLMTYVNLTSYGYTNVYELGPLLEVNHTRLPFAGSEVSP